MLTTLPEVTELDAKFAPVPVVSESAATLKPEDVPVPVVTVAVIAWLAVKVCAIANPANVLVVAGKLSVTVPSAPVTG
jgi:hypothetical protein